mgnify:CR=1 FL=1
MMMITGNDGDGHNDHIDGEDTVGKVTLAVVKK